MPVRGMHGPVDDFNGVRQQRVLPSARDVDTGAPLPVRFEVFGGLRRRVDCGSERVRVIGRVRVDDCLDGGGVGIGSGELGTADDVLQVIPVPVKDQFVDVLSVEDAVALVGRFLD